MAALRTTTPRSAARLLSRHLASLSLSTRPAASPSAPAAAAAAAAIAVARSYRLVHTSTPTAAAASEADDASASASASASTSAADADADADAAQTWTPVSQRVGLIAVKRGMTSFFLPSGERIPATVLQVHSNQVSAHIGFDKHDGYTALQVAAIDTPKATRQVLGHLGKADIRGGKKVIREFRVSRDAVVPLGTSLSVMHFVPGQSVDVRGITRGHGFQGVMKRHGFHGLRASHGVSISHRSGGSYGANQDPGRVWPGKKSPGRMGGNKHGTVHNLLVVRVDSAKELIYVKGNVPGPDGAHVTLQDARRPSWKAQKIYRRGRRVTGEALTGKEPDSIFLPPGVERVPFPAGDKKLAATLPTVVEIGTTPS